MDFELKQQIKRNIVKLEFVCLVESYNTGLNNTLLWDKTDHYKVFGNLKFTLQTHFGDTLSPNKTDFS